MEGRTAASDGCASAAGGCNAAAAAAECDGGCAAMGGASDTVPLSDSPGTFVGASSSICTACTAKPAAAASPSVERSELR
eukprot:1625126-Prymnesium_polylepis.2